MGGSAPAPDNSAMLAMIASQEKQQAAAQQAAAEAQRQALISSQDVAAQQAMTQAAQQAQQNLGRMQAYQSAQDAATLAAQQKSGIGAGVGGAFDVTGIGAARMANLGAAAPYLPGTAANVAGSPAAMKNPAMTTATAATPANKGIGAANQFLMPDTSALRLGGV